MTAKEAFERLKAGNQRFLDNQLKGTRKIVEDRLNCYGAQKPFAIILGCSDSRVPAEIIFDQGIGDLFVIRVAGNVVAPTQVGSVEFAAMEFGTPLVVVLGHSNCGAICAAYNQLTQDANSSSPNLSSIVQRIRPTVAEVMTAHRFESREEIIEHSVRANIRVSVEHLRHGSPLLESLVSGNNLAIVGAEYDLQSGKVDFFDTHHLS